MNTTDFWLLGTGICLAGLGAAIMTPAQPERRALGFPATTTAPQGIALLGAVAGFPARSRLQFETFSHDGEVSFATVGRSSDLDSLQATAQGVLPGLRFATPVDEPKGSPKLTTRIGWRGNHVLLRDDEPELTVAALLGALQTTTAAESVRLTTRLRPVVRPRAPRRRNQPPRDWLERLATPATPLIPPDELALVRKLYGAPLLNAALTLEVWAETLGRARMLTRQIVAVLRTRSGRRGRFSARSGRLSHVKGTTLAARQLMPLLAWPLEDPAVPGVVLQRAPVLRVDRRIPVRGNGRVFGSPTWPGREHLQLHQPPIGALSHGLILGPSGTGKSTLLANLIADDITAGRGALLLDMKGDTATALLATIPYKRRHNVVILDPGDTRPLPSLKSFDGHSPELTADLWVGIFRNLFADSWGVRTERYLRLGIQTLAHSKHAVITDLPLLFTDQQLRRRLIAQIDDPFLLSAWAAFEALSPVQQAEHLSAPLGKAQDVLGRRILRTILGQATPKITISQAINRRKIVIVRLNAGDIGPATSQVLGALVLYELHQAVMRRGALPPEARVPFGAYIDEPTVLKQLPVPIDSLLELARGLGVGLTLATQSLKQLPDAVREAALTNAATIASFRADIEDAKLLAPRLHPVTAEELRNLEPFQIVLRMALSHGTLADVTTVATPPVRTPEVDERQIRDLAAANYGNDPQNPDRDAWSRRPTEPAPETAIGRRRRSA